MPRPPRWRPAPPESGRSAKRSIRNGYWISCSSTGALRTSPWQIETEADFAVLARPAAPAAAEDVHQQETPAVGAEAAERAAAHVALVAPPE